MFGSMLAIEVLPNQSSLLTALYKCASSQSTCQHSSSTLKFKVGGALACPKHSHKFVFTIFNFLLPKAHTKLSREANRKEQRTKVSKNKHKHVVIITVTRKKKKIPPSRNF